MHLKKILERKLETLFPNAQEWAKASRVLASYGQEDYEQEPTRIRLAILKLCGQKPTLDDTKTNTRYAREDFRDVLTWAEYPRQDNSRSLEDGPENEELRRADREEYELWLNT